MKLATKAIHAGQSPDPSYGSVIPPLHLTSTFAQEGFGGNKGFIYSRVANPTRSAFEKNIAELESGSFGYAFSSGMAATDAVLRLLKAGDHVIFSRNIYGGTFRIATTLYDRWNLQFDFVPISDARSVISALRPDTKMIFIETPSNPTMELIDLPALSKIARKKNIFTVVDNTFATPVLQRPLEMGIDIVLHSATKYLNGHSDIIGGAVVTNNEELARRIRAVQITAGAIMSPFDAWLCVRGIKTLPLRMAKHCENAAAVAAWLSKQKNITRLYYPGLPSHPQFLLAKKQMSGFGGMISFDVGSLEKAKRFYKGLELCTFAESLGGVETLISHPATMSHAAFPPEERNKAGVTDGLIRLSVGIEDAGDIMDDLRNALKYMRG